MRFVRIPKPAFALQAFDSEEEPDDKGKYSYRVPGFLYDLRKRAIFRGKLTLTLPFQK